MLFQGSRGRYSVPLTDQTQPGKLSSLATRWADKIPLRKSLRRLMTQFPMGTPSSTCLFGTRACPSLSTYLNKTSYLVSQRSIGSLPVFQTHPGIFSPRLRRGNPPLNFSPRLQRRNPPLNFFKGFTLEFFQNPDSPLNFSKVQGLTLEVFHLVVTLRTN